MAITQKSPLAYIGGKSRLAKQIIKTIPEHRCYSEVFAGGAWVFFKKEPSKIERINDLDGELVAFYRVLQNHLEEFLKQFKFLLASREWWEDWKRQLEADGLTDIQKAARYYYVQRLAFGGRVTGRNFGVDTIRSTRINLVRLEEELSAVHLRLTNVLIENLSHDKFIQKYDRPDTFFYCDPPYHKLPYYKHNMLLEDYIALSKQLQNIQGKFILSINNHPDMLEAFKPFNIKKTDILYTLNKTKQVKTKELIISNF